MAYGVYGGRISTWSLEVHVTDHCNLACASCCTLSPHNPSRFLSAGTLARDLELARPALQPAVLKLTGGEPLSHPDIAELARVAKASGVGERLSMTTNGHLFSRASDALLTQLDRITLSWYASAPLSEDALATIEARCAEHGVRLTVKHIETFQALDVPDRGADHPETARVFADCWLKVRCHLLRDQRFYMCTRPPHLDRFHRRDGLLEQGDGVSLDGPRLTERLLAYLQREEALASCRCCLGGSGSWAPHRQLAPKERNISP